MSIRSLKHYYDTNDPEVDMKIYEVDQVLFRLPTETLKQHSDILEDMLSGLAIGLTDEGSSDEFAIKLHVPKCEFEWLLEYIFDSDFCTEYKSTTVAQDMRDMFWEQEPLFQAEVHLPYAATEDTLLEDNSELYDEPATENEIYFGTRCPVSLIPLLCIVHISDILMAQPARRFAIRAVALSSDFFKLSPRDQISLACEARVKEWVRPAFLKLVRQRRTFLDINIGDAHLYGRDFIFILSIARDTIAYILHRLAFEPPPVLEVPSCERREHHNPIMTWFLALFNCEVPASCQQRWKTLWHNVVVLVVLNPSTSTTTYGLERDLRREATNRLCYECAVACINLRSIGGTYVPMQRRIEELALLDSLRALGFDVPPPLPEWYDLADHNY